MLKKRQDFSGNRRERMPAMEPITLYLVISLLNMALFFLLLPFLGQHGFDWVVMENNSDFESADYFLCLLFSMGKENVYGFCIEACYSPLSYVLYYVICKMTSMGKLLEGVDLLMVPYEKMVAMTPQLLVSPYQLLMFVIYSMMGMLLYVFAVEELKLGKRKKQLFTLSVLCSVPMLFGAVERGNLTLYVAALVLLAFLLKDSESSVKRETALLLIAIAAGLKFYPAFMGLLYLKEKRYKEAGRLILYGVIFVFVPFLFFGGIDGFLKLLENLVALSVQSSYHYRIQFFKGALTFLGIHGKPGDLLNMVFICVLVLFIMIAKNKTHTMVYMAAALAFYAPNGYRYMLLFFLLPLFAWIDSESGEHDAASYATAVFFSCIFSIPTLFGLVTKFELTFGPYTLTYVEFFIYLAAWTFLAFVFIRDILEITARWRKKRDEKILSKGRNI